MTKPKWEEEFDDNYIAGSVDPRFYNDLKDLIRQAIEEAVREHDAKWHPLDKQGNMVNLHLVEEAVKEERARIKVMVAGLIKDADCHESFLDGYQSGCVNEHYSQAITDVLGKIINSK